MASAQRSVGGWLAGGAAVVFAWVVFMWAVGSSQDSGEYDESFPMSGNRVQGERSAQPGWYWYRDAHPGGIVRDGQDSFVGERARFRVLLPSPTAVVYATSMPSLNAGVATLMPPRRSPRNNFFGPFEQSYRYGSSEVSLRVSWTFDRVSEKEPAKALRQAQERISEPYKGTPVRAHDSTINSVPCRILAMEKERFKIRYCICLADERYLVLEAVVPPGVDDADAIRALDSFQPNPPKVSGD